MSDTVTRVSIVCADKLLRELLADLLRRRFQAVVSSDPAIEQPIAQPPDPAPDMLLLRLLPGSADQLSRMLIRLRTALPSTRIVVLMDRDDIEGQMAAVRADTDGTVHMDTSAAALADSMALVLAGERAYPSLLIDRMLMQRTPAAPAQGGSGTAGQSAGLSETERKVLRLLVAGYANKEIGRRLGFSESTVKVHVRRICRRTGSSNRTQAAMWAIANGLGRDAEPDGSAPDGTMARVTRLYD